jgi:hypothetical protein
MTARAIMIQEMALRTAVGTWSVQAAELVDGDAELLQAIAGGDRSAFDRLSRRHLDRAYGVALRMTGSRADAQDVVQDVFLRLWQRPDAWRPGQAQFSTWLYRVVVNRCLDLKRRPKGHRPGLGRGTAGSRRECRGQPAGRRTKPRPRQRGQPIAGTTEGRDRVDLHGRPAECRGSFGDGYFGQGL